MCQSDTHRDPYLLVALEHEGVAPNAREDLLGATPKGVRRTPGQQQRHLVATEPTHDVAAARGLHEESCQLNQHLVPPGCP